MITPNSYADALSKSEKMVSERVEAYLKDPNEENVHDLRSSIRRLLATMNILPKKIRASKQSKRYVEGYEKLLKLNAKIRDVDIVVSKLPNHGDDPAFTKLVKRLTRLRDSSLKQARHLASSIQNVSDLSVRPDDLSKSVIQKRFKKTSNDLAKKLKKRLRIVVKEPKNQQQLHKLREDSRRLRFTLEIDKALESSRVLPVLESWQKVLGAIRDSDIFISHFKEKKDSSVKEALEREISARNENYEKFLEMTKESPDFSKIPDTDS